MQKFEVPIKFVSLNEYIELCKRRKGNYNPAQNYKHKVQNEIVMHIKRQKVKKIKKPVRLRFIWYEATKRRDKDNVAFGKKFLLDGMQSAGILPSDNNQWIAGFAGEDFVYGKGQKVVVEIYDCDELEGDKMENKELMSCPFCGGEAEMFPINIKPQYGYWVICSNCGVEQPQYKTKEEAITAWNKRSDKIPVGNGENYEVTHNDNI